ncbi:rRNA pseudouridine synthase [Joostella atrarenae]|uniref:rRNA pseudouridine synthase n=1 Tax=Joostella atrarenae TaxID=679257 RepID=A0ABS9J0K1_9FLAO|nr:pseudouridine synthase [Joostella atrarenae]MCF8713964.1 rRNA pseudouridine synthase [Joostella atrarenae]
MSREDKSRKGKSSGRDAGGNKKFSGRQGGNMKGKSFARGNSPVKSTPSPKKSKSASDEIRLNKYIANSGVCSRRDADIYIASGNVTVNGNVVIEMGYKVKLSDEVKFDGRSITPEKKAYVLLNKPKGFITGNSEEKGKRSVMDLVGNSTKSRIAPVGMLERNSTGLLLFTNDIELSSRLTQGQGFRKIYHVTLDKTFKHEDLHRVREGLVIDEKEIKVEEITFIEGGNKNEIGIKIYSNRNRIVSRIFKHLEYEIIKIDRVAYGGLTKKDLPRGTWRHLTNQELINLKML